MSLAVSAAIKRAPPVGRLVILPFSLSCQGSIGPKPIIATAVFSTSSLRPLARDGKSSGDIVTATTW